VFILPATVEGANPVLVNVCDPLSNRLRRELWVRALRLRGLCSFSSHICIRDLDDLAELRSCCGRKEDLWCEVTRSALKLRRLTTGISSWRVGEEAPLRGFSSSSGPLKDTTLPAPGEYVGQTHDIIQVVIILREEEEVVTVVENFLHERRNPIEIGRKVSRCLAGPAVLTVRGTRVPRSTAHPIQPPN
jgi:hypothetical protein